MDPRAARITAAVEELAAELAHADGQIADQQARIEALERQIICLQALVEAKGAAA